MPIHLRPFALGALIMCSNAQAQPAVEPSKPEEAVYSRGHTPSAEQLEKDRRFRQEEAEQKRRYEVEQEPVRRPPNLRSDCDDVSDAPAFCIERLGPEQIAKGTGLRYRVTWRNLAEPLALAIALERSAPTGTRWRYHGRVGPLLHGGMSLKGSGAREFDWIGREIACAPTDFPMYCDGVEVGEYHLGAYIFALAGPPVPGRHGAHPAVVPMMLAPDSRLVLWSRSAAFSIASDPDLQPLLRHGDSLRKHLQERLGFFIPFFDWSLLKAPLRASRTADGFCASVKLEAPLRGTVRACLPAEAMDRYGLDTARSAVTFSGDAAFLPGLIPQAEAELIARRLATKGYENAADYIGRPGFAAVRARFGFEEAQRKTFFSTYIPEANYRPEAGGYWLFIVQPQIRTLADSGSGGPGAVLLIKVEPSGRACIVGDGIAGEYRPSIRQQEPNPGLSSELARRNFDIEGWSQPCPTDDSGPANPAP